MQNMPELTAQPAALGVPDAPAIAAPAEPAQWLTLSIVALPLLACVLCGLMAALRVKSKLPAWAVVACLGAAFLATVKVFLDRFAGGHAESFVAAGFEWIRVSWKGGGDGEGGERVYSLIADFSLYVDALTIVWMLFVTGLGTLIALYASEYMAHDAGPGYCRFFAAFALFVFSMACLVMADNLLLLYLGWEGVGLCSYLLIGYFYKKPSAVAAAKKAFIMNRIGDLFLAMGIMLIFLQFGTVRYTEVFAQARVYIDLAAAGRWEQVPTAVQLIPLFLMGGAFGKSAQLPLYVWLPDAMEGPTPVSALIHAATMVTAGVFLVARTYPLFLLSEWALPAVGWIGAMTALLSATIGMAQFDIKRIMAYSTVSQLGYMFCGLAVLTPTGGVFHVVTHAFFKALLFLCCGAVMHGFAGQLDLRKLSGVMKLPGWKVVGIGMLVGCLNLAGFPFTAGFFSKDMILAEAFVTPGTAGIGWVLLLTAGLTAYYTFRVFFRVFAGPVEYTMGEEGHDAHHDDLGHGGEAAKAPEPAHAHEPHAPGWAINTVLATLAALSLAATGLYFVKGDQGAVASLVQQSSAAFTSPYTHHATGDGAHDAHAAPSFQPVFVQAQSKGHEPHAGSFLGMDPHAAMYYASSAVGIAGIVAAFLLHLAGRTGSAASRADLLLARLGPIPGWAQGKWYVDEFYDFLVCRPVWVLAYIFYLIDTYVVDGLVDLFGAAPRHAGGVIRPTQSGELHGYALGMAGGIAVLIVIVVLVAT
jgi:NADH-quinone oxidoreductase subunit L